MSIKNDALDVAINALVGKLLKEFDGKTAVLISRPENLQATVSINFKLREQDLIDWYLNKFLLVMPKNKAGQPVESNVDLPNAESRPVTCLGTNIGANAYQVGGQHYNAKSLQPWDVIIAWNLGFLDGNAMKYLARWRDKGGIEDLKKAKHYIEKLIEVETKEKQ